MRKCILIVATAALAAFAATSSHAQTLEKIKQRGVLVVGTKADYKPFGFRDPSGAIVGFEPDLAKDVADRLGVKLTLEPVVSANRMQFLQQGKIDLMIATMNVTDERKKTVGVVDPSYYASNWRQRARQPQGRAQALGGSSRARRSAAFRARSITNTWRRNMGADIVAFRGQNEAETAIGARATASAWRVHDDTAFQERLADPRWAGFEMPLETIRRLRTLGRRRDQARGARRTVGPS